MEGVVLSIKKNYLQSVNFILIFLLALSTILLTIQNYKLKIMIKELTNPPDFSLKSGDRIESFQALTLSGDTVNILFTDTSKNYVFFILTTSCPHCLYNLKYWNMIAESSKNKNYDVFSISLDDPRRTIDYVVSQDVGFYTLSVTDTVFKKKNKFKAVPQTIITKGNGIIQQLWLGELDSLKMKEIIKYF